MLKPIIKSFSCQLSSPTVNFGTEPFDNTGHEFRCQYPPNTLIYCRLFNLLLDTLLRCLGLSVFVHRNTARVFSYQLKKWQP